MAMARPIPVVPVTIATFPANSFMAVASLVHTLCVMLRKFCDGSILAGSIATCVHAVKTSAAYNFGFSGARTNVKIVRLKTAVVEGNFDWTFVRIETDEGILGLGECFFAPGLTSILRSLEPLLVGEDPRDIRRLFRKLQLATSGAGSVAGIIYNAISGIEAALWDVLGQSLDVPIYRLLGGKFRDRVRVYADCHAGEALESLDEVLRSRSPSWIAQDSQHVPKDYFGESGEAPSSPDDYRKQALAMRSLGYTALKFDLDVPGTEGSDLYNR